MERRLKVLGTAVEKPGGVSRGTIPLLHQPSGNLIELRVVIVSGKHDGPTLLVTGNIHGDEVTGIIVIHRLLERLETRLDLLKGRVIAIPSLNPTGLLAGTRLPVFEHVDPNRTWPDSIPESLKEKYKDADDTSDLWHAEQKKVEDQQGPQAMAFKEVFAAIEHLHPDYHVDLHTFSTLSIPFIFLDRVLYNDEGEEGVKQKEEADKLFATTESMVHAIGLTVIRERPAKLYIKQKLHRSTSGATLNKMRIPSCTIELGPMDCVKPQCRDAGIIALENLLRWASMLDGVFEKLEGRTVVLKFTEPHRYLVYPQAPTTGVVDFLKDAGEPFEKGEEIAVIRHINGEIIKIIKAEMCGNVIGWFQGIAKYEGMPLGMVAVPDGKETPMVVPWSSLPPSIFQG